MNLQKKKPRVGPAYQWIVFEDSTQAQILKICPSPEDAQQLKSKNPGSIIRQVKMKV